MLKKLLTLCLALAMLSSIALASSQTYVLAAETDTVYEEPFTADKMTLSLYYGNNVESANWDWTATANKYFKYTDNPPVQWLLVKVEVGENWILADADGLSLDTQIQLNQPGDYTQYIAPITKAEYEAAMAGNAAFTPSTRSLVDTVSKSEDGSGKKSATATLTPAKYANAYDGEYLYMAIEWIASTNSYTADGKSVYVGFTKDGANKGSWSLTINATKSQEIATVTASKEIVEIRNDLSSFEQTVTLNPAEPYSKGLAGWLLYKFDLGKTFTDVTKVTLDCTWSPDAATAFAYIYKATQSEYDAAKSEAGTTLSQAENHSLLEANYRSGKSHIARYDSTIDKDTATSETFSLDLTDKLATVCKNGVVYLEFSVGNSGADSNARKAENIQLTLTVEGAVGEYTASAKTIEEDNCLVWDNGTYKFYTPATSGTVKLVLATYGETGMADAEVITINVATDVVDGVKTGTAILSAGEGETLKVYLWDGSTLVPLRNVIEFAAAAATE